MKSPEVQFTPEDRLILDSYCQMLDGLAQYLGTGYELVLHSLEDLVALFIVALLTWSHISVNTVLLAIYPIVMLFAFSLGVGLILSTMYVFVRDIMHIWEVFCTLLVYGSAIFYDPRQMESWMQYVINLNPIYWYITSVRSCVMWGEGLTPNMVLIPFLCAALSLGLGVYVFKKNQDKFVLYM